MVIKRCKFSLFYTYLHICEKTIKKIHISIDKIDLWLWTKRTKLNWVIVARYVTAEYRIIEFTLPFSVEYHQFNSKAVHHPYIGNRYISMYVVSQSQPIYRVHSIWIYADISYIYLPSFSIYTHVSPYNKLLNWFNSVSLDGLLEKWDDTIDSLFNFNIYTFIMTKNE